MVGQQMPFQFTVLSSSDPHTFKDGQLKPGELIVSSGVHHIEDGETVKPLPLVTNTNIGGLL